MADLTDTMRICVHGARAMTDAEIEATPTAALDELERFLAELERRGPKNKRPQN